MTVAYFLAPSFQDPEALVRTLQSNDPGLQEKATQNLIDMGPTILVKLEAHEEAGDDGRFDDLRIQEMRAEVTASRDPWEREGI